MNQFRVLIKPKLIYICMHSIYVSNLVTSKETYLHAGLTLERRSFRRISTQLLSCLMRQVFSVAVQRNFKSTLRKTVIYFEFTPTLLQKQYPNCALLEGSKSRYFLNYKYVIQSVFCFRNRVYAFFYKDFYLVFTRTKDFLIGVIVVQLNVDHLLIMPKIHCHFSACLKRAERFY